MRKIGMSLWSIGSHARKNLLPALGTSPDVLLVGVFSRDKVTRETEAALHSCKAYECQEQMLADPAIGCVWIASPNGVHFEQVEEALAAGKHVLVEKTAFASLQEAKRAVSLARDRNLVLMEAFMYRFHPQFIALQHILKDQEFGEMHQLSAHFGFPDLALDNVRYQTGLAGGALNDAGAYTVSIGRQLLGAGLSVIGSVIRVDPDRGGVDVGGEALLRSADGSASASLSWGFGAAYRSEIIAWCSRGIVHANRIFAKPGSLETKIVVSLNGETIKVISVPAANHFVLMLEYFANRVSAREFAGESDELLLQAEALETIRAGKLA